MRYLGLTLFMCYSLATFAQEIPVTARRGLLLSKAATTFVFSSPHTTTVILLNPSERKTLDLNMSEAGNEGWSSFQLVDEGNLPVVSGFSRVIKRHTFELVSQLARQKPRPTIESLRNVIDALEYPCEPILINDESTELLVIEDQSG